MNSVEGIVKEEGNRSIYIGNRMRRHPYNHKSQREADTSLARSRNLHVQTVIHRRGSKIECGPVRIQHSGMAAGFVITADEEADVEGREEFLNLRKAIKAEYRRFGRETSDSNHTSLEVSLNQTVVQR